MNDRCRAFLFGFAILSVMWSPLHAAALSPKDGVIAEINDRRITSAELERELSRQLRTHRQVFEGRDLHLVRRRMLERLIERELLYQEAMNRRLAPSEEELKLILADVKAERGSEAAFLEALQESGLSPAEFRDGLRIDIAIKRYLERDVFSGVEVKDDELRTAFERDPARFKQPPEVRARHILFIVAPDAPAEEVATVRARALKVLEAARSGLDFAGLARRHSEAPNRANGGDLGFFTENQLEPTFSAAAFALNTGEISDLVRTNYGFHVIKLEERRGDRAPTFSDVSDKVRRVVLAEKQERRLEETLKNLRAAARVVVYLQ